MSAEDEERQRVKIEALEAEISGLRQHAAELELEVAALRQRDASMGVREARAERLATSARVVIEAPAPGRILRRMWRPDVGLPSIALERGAIPGGGVALIRVPAGEVSGSSIGQTLSMVGRTICASAEMLSPFEGSWEVIDPPASPGPLTAPRRPAARRSPPEAA